VSRFGNDLADLSGGILVPVAHALRNFTRQRMISPLRKEMKLVERLTSLGLWGKVDYARVPSICMTNMTVHFFNHDQERFLEYLDDVSQGKKAISGAVIPPHELVARAANSGEIGRGKRNKCLPKALELAKGKIVDGQWSALVERMRESGHLGNSIAVCDVSGSMGCIDQDEEDSRDEKESPIFMAVAFSLLLARLTSPPFADHFITFSDTPQLVKIDPKLTLIESVRVMEKADWSNNTNFRSVFLDLILPAAKKANLPPEEMVKRIFVFSDMEFDEANDRFGDYYSYRSRRRRKDDCWETDHEVIKKAFAKAGYEVPTIVYWNLNASPAPCPVLGNEPGVALMSGSGAGALKVFMDGAEVKEKEEVEDKEVREGKGSETEVSEPEQQGVEREQEEEEDSGNTEDFEVVSNGASEQEMMDGDDRGDDGGNEYDEFEESSDRHDTDCYSSDENNGDCSDSKSEGSRRNRKGEKYVDPMTFVKKAVEQPSFAGLKVYD
jgi:hypothetical protein